MNASTYLFNPKRNNSVPTVITESKFLTEDECDYILDIGERTEISKSTISDGVVKNKRNSSNGWISHNFETNWIFNKLENKITEVNQSHFQFDILGFYENLQYTVYGPDNNHYTTHRDSGSGFLSVRKLSTVIMLSEPSDYQGGDLEIFVEGEYKKIDKDRGNPIILYFFILLISLFAEY